MRTGLVAITLVLLSPATGRGSEAPLLAADWQPRLRSYEHSLCAFYQQAVASRTADYGTLLATVYGPRTAGALITRAKRSATTSPIEPQITLSGNVAAAVIVDPVAERDGLHAYLRRKEGVIAVNPPGGRRAYDPLRQATALAHEITHLAQRRAGRYPGWITAWMGRLEREFPTHPGTYVLSIEEAEVRLAELRRMIWVAGHVGEPTADIVRRWLAALGVSGVTSTRGRPLPPSLLPADAVLEIAQTFPDAVELIDTLRVQLQGEAEARRQALIALWADGVALVL